MWMCVCVCKTIQSSQTDILHTVLNLSPDYNSLQIHACVPLLSLGERVTKTLHSLISLFLKANIILIFKLWVFISTKSPPSCLFCECKDRGNRNQKCHLQYPVWVGRSRAMVGKPHKAQRWCQKRNGRPTHPSATGLCLCSSRKPISSAWNRPRPYNSGHYLSRTSVIGCEVLS